MTSETTRQEHSQPGGPSEAYSAHRDIACANCGTPLTGKAGEEDIPCMFCGQKHRFLAPPETTDIQDFQMGDTVAVEWDGHWWSAHVVKVLPETNQWHVHFEGWAPAFDETVGTDRIRAIDYLPGESIVPPPITVPVLEVKKASMLTAAGVVFALLVLVGFLAYWALADPNTADSRPDTTAQAGIMAEQMSDVRVPADMAIQVGQKYQVHWADAWYVGTVMNVADSGEITIRYDGWGDGFDEVVPRENLRMMK